MAVNAPRIRRHLSLLVLASAAVILSIYLLNAYDKTLQLYLTGEFSATDPPNLLRIVKIVLWAGLALAFVRALNATIFGLTFRFRRGYEAPNLIRNIFSIIAFAACFVLIFKHYYKNVDLGALLTTSAVLGVIIGLALQDTLGNLFAGISVHADRPFQVGDVIAVGQHKLTGVVESINWRAVKIRTFQNHIMLISNSSIAREAIEVCPRDNLNARLVTFGAHYYQSPSNTIHIIKEAVREADNVSQKITPIVRIRDLSESAVEYEVKYWLEDYARYNDTDALVRQRIWYAFRRARFNFAFPTRSVHLEQPFKSDSTSADSRSFLERLSSVDIFQPLSAEELASLAESSTSHIYAAGETVIRAGDKGSSMFVVHNGCVDVRITDNGQPRTIATFDEGEFFGEMALFTGEPRTASVVAIEETQVIEIGHEALKQLFDTNPDLVESLSRTIAQRHANAAAKASGVQTEAVESAGIIASVRRFFGLG